MVGGEHACYCGYTGCMKKSSSKKKKSGGIVITVVGACAIGLSGLNYILDYYNNNRKKYEVKAEA